MTQEEFAVYERILGQKIVAVNGIHWAQVRPCFFRTLLPFREYAPDAIRPPQTAFFGGFQHAVPVQSTANSFLHLRLFDNPKDYTVNTLDYNRKRQVKLAGEAFVIRQMFDVEEFKAKAYAMYLSFDERTHYKTGTWRRRVNGFARWADAVFQVPKIVVLGGYQEDHLLGVCVSMYVEDTVIYASSFCDTKSLQGFLPDLMLHSVREMAARCPDVVRVFAGMCIGERGLDDFYVLRGCQLVKKPAVLRLNPVAERVLRVGLPRQYAKLLGNYDK